jgi:hypothetical protein
MLAVRIMAAGMLLAVLWAAYEGWGLGKGYPYNTFLLIPSARFGDYMDGMIVSRLPDPYEDPYMFYLPFYCALSRAVSVLPDSISLIGFFFLSLAGLVLLLIKVLEKIIPDPIQRVFYSFLFLGLSYPVLFCLDRGNIEIEIVTLIAAYFFFLTRCHFVKAMLCLLAATALKAYPAILFVYFLRQRKLAWTAVSAAAFFAITFLSLAFLDVPVKTAWTLYQRDMAYCSTLVYENHTLEGCAALWNTYKAGLIIATHWGWIAPVDFSYDGSFIRSSYAIYSGFMILLALSLVIYAFVEKELLRSAIPFLLFLTMATPLGSDYRLLHADIALIALVLLKTKRRHDLLVLILITLTLIPKKEIVFPFIGQTESGVNDVSIQVLTNPLCVFAAIFLLLLDGWRQFDARWSIRRLFRLTSLLGLKPRLLAS